MKTCTKCSTDKPYEDFYPRGGREGVGAYCKVCVNRDLLVRIKKFKQDCLDYKGGSCEKCGYSKCVSALEFHHRDPTEKEFSISKVKRKKFDKTITDELDKCSLLCANCHREEHERLAAQ